MESMELRHNELKRIGRLVKQRREMLGWSPGELSRQSGVSRGTILYIEDASREARFSRFLAISTSLGMPVTGLLGPVLERQAIAAQKSANKI